MSQQTVSSTALNGAAGLIRSYGVDPILLARLAGLDAGLLDQPAAKLSVASLLRFMDMAATACNEPQFGIELAQRQGLEILGPVWILARHAETVGDSLDSICQALALHSEALAMVCEPTEDGLRVDYDILCDADVSAVQGIEQSFALLCNEIRVVAGPRWYPRYLQFRHDAPAQLEKHRAVFGRALHFNQDRNALLLDQRTLALRINNDPRAHRVIQKHLRLQRHTGGDSFVTRVSQVIRNLLNSEGCDAERVARALGLTLRTLQHRLALAGTHYQEILDDNRLRLAQRYLRDSNLPIAGIAELLHFSETSAFSRFFRKHTGVTPRQYQRRQQGLQAAADKQPA